MPALHDLFVHDVRLKQLRLQNFRGFRVVTLDFHPDKPVTVLIADNGGGKSTVLDATAEFLRRFFQLAIAGKNEGDDKETLLGEKNIFNGSGNAVASAVLELYYPYPYKELFQWMDECARYLDENHFEGEVATLALEGEVWTLQLKQKEEYITYYLSDEFQKRLDTMASDKSKRKMLSTENLGFEVAVHDDGAAWQPNLSLSAKEANVHAYRKGNIEFKFELRRNRPDSINYTSLPTKPNTYEDFIQTWEKEEVFIADYKDSTSHYDRFNPLNPSNEILPLLVYYGGSAINTKYDGELKLPYRPRAFQAYHNAFKPKRFDFEEFFTWALWASEKQAYAWELATKTILDVMNADQELYKAIRIEAQMLIFDKKPKPEDENAEPVEIFQLSAGEKNIVALIGDLVKRAVQLNVILFNVDFDPTEGTLSNPLTFTPGIVLIDEIDLHLHPRWQRVIVPKLREHFPRVQFVVTTHSPFVVQSVPADNRLIIDKNQIVVLNRQTELSYETIVNDYFDIDKLFDDDSEKLIEILIEFKNKILNNEIKITDNNFLKVLKKISTKSNEIKAIAAREIRILNNSILENGKNK